MGTGESPSSSGPDPSLIRNRADFARALTHARTRAGLTVRGLATQLDLPAATVGDYCSGRHLPGPSQLDSFRDLLRACGVPEAGLDRWIDALHEVRSTTDRRRGRTATSTATTTTTTRAPYPGLERFEVADADRFFGREQLTDTILDRIANQPRRGGAAVDLMVIGASGSGKSSLLRAGVAAALRDDAVVILPGDPIDKNRRQPELLLVDQLEEMFSLEPAARAAFLDQLRQLPASAIVAALRADFYAAALAEPLLADALTHPILVPRMGEEELRRTILGPAERLGVRVEPALPDLLLADLADGDLPLLSHALLATWTRGRGDELTVADYRASGGLRQAISQTAEQVWEQLTPANHERTRSLLLRLVRVTEDEPLTRRRVPRDELAGSEDIVDRFIAARLLTAEADTVTLSHEVLLSAWPRLAGWVASDRAGLALRHQIIDGARAWAAANHEPALLLRGAPLQACAEWSATTHGDELNPTERAFLTAGQRQADAERRRTRAQIRRTRQLLTAVSALAIAAVAMAIVAIHARHQADVSRDDALSRQVAIEADTLARSDPALAMQLALISDRIAPTLQATSALLDRSAGEMPTRVLGADGPTAEAVSDRADLLALADSARNEVTLYRLNPGSRLQRLTQVTPTGPAQQLFSVAISPNGRLLAAGGTDGHVSLWSLSRPHEPVRIATFGGFSSTVYAVAFNHSGSELAAADADGSLRLWPVSHNRDLNAGEALLAPGRPSLAAVTFSPNGRTLMATGGDELFTWSLPARHLVQTRQVGSDPLTTVADSPNGATVAVGSQDSHVYLFTAGGHGRLTPRGRPLGGFANWVDSLAFSADGDELAAGDSDSTARVWWTRSWTPLATLTHPAPVTGVAFTAGGDGLITADEDGTGRIWSLPTPDSVREPGGVFSIDYTANGRELAAVSGGPAGDVDLWDTADPWRPSHLATVDLGAAFGPAAGVEALSPDGQLLALANPNGEIRLVRLTPGGGADPVGPLLTGATPYAEQLAFSPDMRTLEASDASGRIELWDISDPRRPRRLATIDPSGRTGAVLGIADSPDGRLLAAASNDDRVRIWGIADLRHPRLLSTLGGFRGYANTVTFTPNGRTLIAGSSDDTVRLWNVSVPTRPRELGRPLTAATSAVYDLAVDPSGTRLAAATTGHDVLLWNIRDPAHPTQVADLTAATGVVYDVTFSPDGDFLSAGGADQILHFWDDRPGQVARRICARAGAPITRAEWARYVQGRAYDPPCGT